jgi:hypothetical protein
MKTAKLTLKALSKFMGLMALTVFIFSCGQNGQQNLNANNVFTNCANCGAITGGQTFFQSQSQDTMYGMTVNLSFIGNVGFNPYNNQYGQVQQFQNAAYNPIVSYMGVVAAQGSLQLSQPIGFGGGSYNPQFGQMGGCFMPAGVYTIGTMQAGQWNQAIVSNLILSAVGPAQVIISIPQAQVSAKSQMGATWNEVAPAGRLFGNFVIQSVNGVACNIGTLIQ